MGDGRTFRQVAFRQVGLSLAVEPVEEIVRRMVDEALEKHYNEHHIMQVDSNRASLIEGEKRGDKS